MTLETAGAFFAGAVFRLAILAGAFFAFATDRLAGLTATFLAGLREVALAAVARFAFGLAAAFALTARFAVFVPARPGERDADRRRPFVRLLLIVFFHRCID